MGRCMVLNCPEASVAWFGGTSLCAAHADELKAALMRRAHLAGDGAPWPCRAQDVR